MIVLFVMIQVFYCTNTREYIQTFALVRGISSSTRPTYKSEYLYLSVTLILTELFQHNLINVSYLTASYLYQVMMTLHFLNDVANDVESTQKSTITS